MGRNHRSSGCVRSLEGSYERSLCGPLLLGERRIKTKDGRAILCRPIFAELAKLAARYNPETSAAITYVPAAKARQAARFLQRIAPSVCICTTASGSIPMPRKQTGPSRCFTLFSVISISLAET